MTNSDGRRHSGHALRREGEVSKTTSWSHRLSSRTKGPDVKPRTLIESHRPCSTLLLDDLVAEGLGAAPLPDAGQTEGVTAGGQDTEPAVRRIGLLNHHLHTDGTYLNNRQNIPESQTGGTHHWQRISSG